MGAGDCSPAGGVLRRHIGDVPASLAADGDQERHQVVLLEGQGREEGGMGEKLVIMSFIMVQGNITII